MLSLRARPVVPFRIPRGRLTRGRAPLLTPPCAAATLYDFVDGAAVEEIHVSTPPVSTAFSAAAAGNTTLVAHLLFQGAEKELGDKDGWTPLMIAARKGHKNVVAHLLSIGADKDATNKARRSCVAQHDV